MLPIITSDEQILKEFQNSNQFPLPVYEEYNKKAFERLCKMGASREVALEITHDTWVPFLREIKLPRFEIKWEGCIYAYFCRICINKFLNHCRNEKQSRNKINGYINYMQNDQDNQSTTLVMAEEETWSVKKEKLLDHLAKNIEEVLSSKCRKLIQYRYWQKLSINEIDQLIGAKNSKGTSSAKSELSRCRKKLKSLLQRLL